jgi:uncharacterized protein
VKPWESPTPPGDEVRPAEPGYARRELTARHAKDTVGPVAAPIVHIELRSANFARTSAFYSQLFDWRIEQNASGSYMKHDSADGPTAGWIRADLVQAPGPVAYLVVEDLAAKLQEVEDAGGRILVRSLPFAGGGEIGLFADPDGNVIGLWRRKSGGPTGGAPSGSGDAAAAPKVAKAAGKTAAPKAAPKAKKPKK